MVCFRCIWPLSAVSRTAAGSSCLQVNINYCEKNTYRSGLGNQQFYKKCLYVLQDLILTLLMTLEGPVYMLQLLEGEFRMMC